MTEASRLVLYSAAPSFFSQIARLTLIEMALPFTLIEVDIHGRLDQLDPGFALINPALTVPALVDGGVPIPGSDRILAHLVTAFPDRQIAGSDLVERQRCSDWVAAFYRFPIEYLTFATMLKGNPLMKVGIAWKMGQMLRKIDAAIAARPDVAPHFIAKKALLTSRRADLQKPGTLNESMAAYRTLVGEMDAALGKSPWLAGATYTLADVIGTCVLARLSMIKTLGPALDRPSIAAYWARVQERPSFHTAELWARVKPRHALRELTGTLSKAPRNIQP